MISRRAFLSLLPAPFDGERDVDDEVEKQFAWAQFTWSGSQRQWCVDAQRENAKPGEMVGGCWKTLRAAEEGILEKWTRER